MVCRIMAEQETEQEVVNSFAEYLMGYMDSARRALGSRMVFPRTKQSICDIRSNWQIYNRNAPKFNMFYVDASSDKLVLSISFKRQYFLTFTLQDND